MSRTRSILCTDVVINEVMYHSITLPAPDTAADTVTLVAEVAPAKALIPKGRLDRSDLDGRGRAV